MRRALVVDDEPQVLRLLSIVLSAHYQCVACKTVMEALGQLAATRFDVIVVDLILGANSSGLDILRRLPALNRNTRCIVLTGHATAQRYREAFLAGASDVLEKPIRPAKLLAELGLAVGPSSERDCVPSSPDQRASATQGHAERGAEVIARRFAELNLSTSKIADELRISSEHFCRVFQTHVGQTPMRYLHAVRVNNARRLLDDSSKSIYEIARDCGYHDHHEIGLHFRRLTGCTPSQYRARARQVNDGTAIVNGRPSHPLRNDP